MIRDALEERLSRLSGEGFKSLDCCQPFLSDFYQARATISDHSGAIDEVSFKKRPNHSNDTWL